MRSKTIRILILIGAITILSLVLVQFYLLKTTFSNRMKTFEHSVQVALYQVANRINNYDLLQLPQNSPVHKQTNNYYLVDVNKDVDCEILEFFLISEFERAQLEVDFEYAIYDCYTDDFIYGNYISMDNDSYSIPQIESFQKNNELVYYFAVYFPTLKTDIIGSMRIWFVFAVISICVLGFIVYSIVIILGQQRYSQQQRAFVNTITHEFRTPISASNIAVEYLKGSDIINSSSKLRKYTELIQFQNNRLNTLIERLLHSASHEKKHEKSDVGEVKLSETINSIIEGIRTNYSHANIVFNSSQEVKLWADPFHVDTVIFSLIENAVKYGGQKPEVRVLLEKQKRTAVLTVKDNGEGIDKKYWRKIFKQFYRVPTGNKHNVKGFGIGLYSAKVLCRKMKWKIQLKESTPSGSIFTLTIPLKKYEV